MHDVIYVSNEQELEKSLPGNHKVTVFNADYDVGIFKDLKIKWPMCHRKISSPCLMKRDTRLQVPFDIKRNGHLLLFFC